MPHILRDLPNHKPWMITISMLAIVVVLGTCGLGSYLLVKDDQMVIGGVDPSASATIPPRDISSRRTDPDPLTAADVFPALEIIADPSVPPYKRVGNPQLLKDCRSGATADVGKLLLQLGCNQVVRATFLSPDGDYLITAGIFNLRDSAAARQGHREITALIDTGRGRLTGYIATSAAKVLGRAPTHLAWEAEGHFLLYSVIARVDGKRFVPDDPHLKVMVYDIVQKYLRDKVIAQWAMDKGALASASPSTSSPGAGPSAS